MTRVGLLGGLPREGLADDHLFGRVAPRCTAGDDAKPIEVAEERAVERTAHREELKS